MGAMPHITIFTPADPCEAKQCLDLAVETPGPAYIRLAKDKEPVLREPFKSFNVGDFIEYEPGNDVCLVGIGTILSECLSAGKLLGDKISTAVIGLPVFKPLNETKLVEYLKKFSFVATVEEHSFYGGLGSVIADIIARYKLKGKLLKFALPEGFDLTGPNNELRKSCGLEAVQIADKIKEAFSHA
jgi:transketolase